MINFDELMDELKANIDERTKCVEYLAFIRMRNTLRVLLPIKTKIVK